jgi:hypothetical protein
MFGGHFILKTWLIVRGACFMLGTSIHKEWREAKSFERLHLLHCGKGAKLLSFKGRQTLS